MDMIIVSIICNAYNQEKYICDALDGFVMQKTNFDFEVLVHDDASTDNTASIIQEYENKYPKLIKPIYQKENQYSKGVAVTRLFQLSRAKGKYIALCEGDDYWTDPYKLQKQVEAMEAHPEIDICAHSAYMINAETKEIISTVAPAMEETVLTAEQVILGDGGYVMTNSLLYRSSLDDHIPEFRKQLGLDYMLQIHGTLRGGMLFIKDNMSCYRCFSKGSWTEKLQKDSDIAVRSRESIICALKQLDKDTNFAYTTTIQTACLQQKVKVFLLRGEYAAIRKKPYRQIYKHMSFKQKLGLYIREYFPMVIVWWKALKNKS